MVSVWFVRASERFVCESNVEHFFNAFFLFENMKFYSEKFFARIRFIVFKSEDKCAIFQKNSFWSCTKFHNKFLYWIFYRYAFENISFFNNLFNICKLSFFKNEHFIQMLRLLMGHQCWLFFVIYVFWNLFQFIQSLSAC